MPITAELHEIKELQKSRISFWGGVQKYYWLITIGIFFLSVLYPVQMYTGFMPVLEIGGSKLPTLIWCFWIVLSLIRFRLYFVDTMQRWACVGPYRANAPSPIEEVAKGRFTPAQVVDMILSNQCTIRDFEDIAGLDKWKANKLSEQLNDLQAPDKRHITKSGRKVMEYGVIDVVQKDKKKNNRNTFNKKVFEAIDPITSQVYTEESLRKILFKIVSPIV